MGKEQPPDEVAKDKGQTETVVLEATDVKPDHVRGLMYTLVTICVFCVSILVGPDGEILAADGDLQIPIVDLKIKQGSFLYFGPIIIICLSLYTYLFLLKVLKQVKAGQESSDQYIFTMKSPTAQVATYGIFFWLPALTLFAFAYKGLPRPESANLLGLALIFLISVVAIQIALRISRFGFRGAVAVGICVVFVLSGFVGDDKSSQIEDKGWLEWVRVNLNTHRRLVLESIRLEKRDLRGVEIRNANADSIVLNNSDLRGAEINGASLKEAKLVGADLQGAILDCSEFIGADFGSAELGGAKLRRTNFKQAKFRSAKLVKANFHTSSEGVSCSKSNIAKILSKTSLEGADLAASDLTEANLSGVDLTKARFNGAKMEDAKIIGAKIKSANFMDLPISLKAKRTRPTNLKRADLRCSRLNDAMMQGAILYGAELGGTNFSGADLTKADLSGAFFNPLGCSPTCINSYINADCSGDDVRKSEKQCQCDGNVKTTKLENTNFRFANLTRSRFEGANLTDADFRGANLKGANLSGATIDGIKILLSNLVSVQGLDCTQLMNVDYWMTAIRDDSLACGEKNLNFEELSVSSTKSDKKQALEVFHSVLQEFARSHRKRPESDGRKSWKDKLDYLATYRKMESAKLKEVDLANLNLEGLRLNRAKLNKAGLINTILKNANLKDADLSGANLQNARLEGAVLKGTKLGGANLKGVTGLNCENLKDSVEWEKAYRDEALECKADFPAGSYLKSLASQ
jgi:uncharacterized protein YjbI with pentapeptide repeats